MCRFFLFFGFLFLINQLFAQLQIAGTPKGFLKGFPIDEIPIEEMPSFDVAAFLAEDLETNQYKNAPFRFGKNQQVNLNLKNSGIWREAEGGKLWQLRVQSFGAYAINLTFDRFVVPQGGEMFVYSANKEYVIGMFGYHNNNSEQVFSTDFVAGDDIIIEYFEPDNVANQSDISLYWVTHAYRPVLDFNAITEAFGSSGSCNMNVNCPDGIPWEEQKRAVVMLVSGGNGFCTGALINNTAQQGRPFVLTADHCGSSGFGTWVFRFNWESASCTNPPSSPASLSLSGAVSRANNNASDFRLLELNNLVPSSYKPFFAGWSRSLQAPEQTTCIHHPSGDIKKIAFDDQQAITSSGGAEWEVVWDRNTTTEPGSSGSPLFDQNKRIVGQLLGGTASCTNLSGPDVYGKFDLSWTGGGSPSNSLSSWLDPNNTGQIFIDGYDPNQPQLYALDAALTNVANAIATTTCSDQVPLSVVLENRGTSTITSLLFSIKVNQSTQTTHQWQGVLLSNASTIVNLPLLQLAQGQNNVEVFCYSPNSLIDSNIVNNSLQFSILRALPPSMTVPFLADFQTTSLPVAISIGNPDSAITWNRSTLANGFANGGSSIMVNNYDYDAVGQEDYLTTHVLDLSSAIGPIYLVFDVAYAPYSNTLYDSLRIELTTDCGENWLPMYAKGRVDLPTNAGGFVTRRFTPTANQWRRDSIDLSNFAGSSNLQIRFVNRCGYGNRLFLDNINIFKNTSIGVDLGFIPQNISGNQRTFVCEDSIRNEVQLINAGTQPITQFELSYTHLGVLNNQIWSGNLMPNQQLNLPLHVLNTPSIGTHNLQVNILTVNGLQGDGNLLNNQILLKYEVAEPQISIFGDSIICQGDSVLLTANTQNQVLWSNGSTSDAIWAVAGNYFVKFNQTVCPDSISIQISNHPINTANINVSSTACLGDTIVASASGGIFFDWFVNGIAQISNNRMSILLTNSSSLSLVSTDINGCKSTFGPTSITFNPKPQKPQIGLSNNQLVVVPMANTFRLQWQLNGLPINGANSNVFLPLQTGNYAVEHDNLGCSVLSDNFFYSFVHVDNQNLSNWRIFPNPTKDYLIVQAPKENSAKFNIDIIDLAGRVLAQHSSNNQHFELNLTNLASGVYFIRIQQGEKQIMQKILVNP